MTQKPYLKLSVCQIVIFSELSVSRSDKTGSFRVIVLIHLKIWPKIWKLGSLFCRKTIFYPKKKIFLPVFSLQTVGVVQSGSIVHAPSEFGQEKASHGKCPLTGHWSWGDVHQNLLANTSPWQGQGKGWIFLWLQMNVLFSITARRENQKLALKVFFGLQDY